MHDWQAILDQHGPLVWRVAHRLLGHEADAADCFQDTFVAAVRVARQQPVMSWPALLRRIATARALDRLRQRSRSPGHEPWHDDLPGTSNTGPQQSAEAAETVVRIRQALTQLPPREADVLCLWFLEQLTYEQIAEQLQISRNAVGVLLHKARRRMRRLLNLPETEDSP